MLLFRTNPINLFPFLIVHIPNKYEFNKSSIDIKYSITSKRPNVINLIRTKKSKQSKYLEINFLKLNLNEAKNRRTRRISSIKIWKKSAKGKYSFKRRFSQHFQIRHKSDCINYEKTSTSGEEQSGSSENDSQKTVFQESTSVNSDEQNSFFESSFLPFVLKVEAHLLKLKWFSLLALNT
jgi:uncharacterized membrane protein YgaE (UPF0421/DUF939 family)